MPLIPGREARIGFRWRQLVLPLVAEGDSPPWERGRHEVLVVHWEGEEARIAFEPFGPELTLLAPAPTPVSACLQNREEAPAWVNLDLGCGDSFADDCDAALACALGSGERVPVCREGSAAAGSSGWCYALCSPTAPCTEGVCTAWQGGNLCM